jgi:hypothetical protein
LLHPKLYSKHPKTNTMNWFDSLNSKDSQEISFNVRDEKKFLKPSKKIMEMQEDIKRQIRFNKRVLAEKIDEDYLENAIERYKRFLLIKVENPGLIIVPTLDIDIIWHSHMLNHKEYINDCHEIFGKILNHEDRLENTKLIQSYSKTSNVWEKKYNEKYVSKKEISSSPSCLSCGFGDVHLHSARKSGNLSNISENPNDLLYSSDVNLSNPEISSEIEIMGNCFSCVSDLT